MKMMHSYIAKNFPSAIFPLFMALVLLLIELFAHPLGFPSAIEMISFFEFAYEEHAVYVILIGSFLETLFMLSLYVPGSFVIFLAVYFSDKSFESLMEISALAGTGVFGALVVNYCIGRFGLTPLFNFLGANLAVSNMEAFFRKRGGKIATFLAGVHPNFLGIALVTNGIAGVHPVVALGIGFIAVLVWVPAMIVVASLIADELNRSADAAPYIIIGIFLLWAIVGGIIDARKRSIKRREEV